MITLYSNTTKIFHSITNFCLISVILNSTVLVKSLINIDKRQHTIVK